MFRQVYVVSYILYEVLLLSQNIDVSYRGCLFLICRKQRRIMRRVPPSVFDFPHSLWGAAVSNIDISCRGYCLLFTCMQQRRIKGHVPPNHTPAPMWLCISLISILYWCENQIFRSSWKEAKKNVYRKIKMNKILFLFSYFIFLFLFTRGGIHFCFLSIWVLCDFVYSF